MKIKILGAGGVLFIACRLSAVAALISGAACSKETITSYQIYRVLGLSHRAELDAETARRAAEQTKITGDECRRILGDVKVSSRKARETAGSLAVRQVNDVPKKRQGTFSRVRK